MNEEKTNSDIIDSEGTKEEERTRLKRLIREASDYIMKKNEEVYRRLSER